LKLSDLIKYIRLVGLNPHIISSLSRVPVNDVYYSILSLFYEHQMTVFPIINSEKLGLWKGVIWCEKSTIPYEKAKQITGPLANLFRGDIEDDSFMLVFYTSYEVFDEMKQTYEKVFDKLNMNCSINLSVQSFRFINDENCYDFENKEWVCNRKQVYISIPSKELLKLDKYDVNLLTDIQVNPAIPYWRNYHYKHIKEVLHGFMYTLGKTNYILDVKSKRIVNDPSLLTIVQLDNGYYIAEYHADKKSLERVISSVNKIKDVEIIISIKDLAFAHGFSIPYEVFKDNKWKIPKIKIE